MSKNLLALLVLAGCAAGRNTIDGAGRDIERGGEKIRDSAEKHKN